MTNPVQPAASNPHRRKHRTLIATCALVAIALFASCFVYLRFTRTHQTAAPPPKPEPVINTIALPDAKNYVSDLKKAGLGSLYPGWSPSHSILHYHGNLLKAKTPLECGNAICCFALIAWEAAHVPDHRQAARDILAQAVMPNLPLCQPGPKMDLKASSCWYEALEYARAIYELLGDEADELRVLDIMSAQSATADERAKAVYFKARHYSKRKNYPEAIKVMEQIDPNTKWGKDRDPFIASWRKSQAEIEKKTAQKPPPGKPAPATQPVKQTGQSSTAPKPPAPASPTAPR